MERFKQGRWGEGTWGKQGNRRKVNHNEGSIEKPYGNLILSCIPIKKCNRDSRIHVICKKMWQNVRLEV